MRVRYRVPTPEAQPRLDHVLRTVLERGLERALGKAGVHPREEVCIRSVYALVRVKLDSADETLMECWSDALAAAIREVWTPAVSRIGERPRPGAPIVRYRSREHALAEMIVCVARQDYSHAWAWRQIGLWRGGERVSAAQGAAMLVDALGRAPLAVVPALTAVADLPAAHRIFQALLARIDGREWLWIAAAALEDAGASVTAEELAETAGPPADVDWTGSTASRTVRASRILAAAAGVGGRDQSRERLVALAALGMLEAEPDLAVRLRPTELRALFETMAPLAAASGPGSASPAGPAAARESALPDRGPSRAPRASTPARSTPRDCRAAQAPVGSPAAAPGATDHTASTRERAVPFTRHGGVLFLLGIVEDLGIPARIAEAIPRRSLRWSLHRLAMILASIEEDDPAALAFAGLAPQNAPPSTDGDPPSEEEAAALALAAAEVSAEVARRLLPLILEPGELLPFVCARAASIIADPGWIEAHFPIGTVSTDLRRAGLDLDPGYLPWLGVVVRFVYE